MILDRLENAERYFSLHPKFAAAFTFIRKAVADLPEAGRNEIDGDEIYALVLNRTGKTKVGAKLEVHRRYIDIQFSAEGVDVIGWKSTAACTQIDKPYDENGDAALFTDAPDAWFDVVPSTFAIFFPEDAHAPLAGDGPVCKIVVKIAV
jgi:biofilm protein TabA